MSSLSWGREEERILRVLVLLVFCFVLYADTTTAACPNTNTYYLRLWNPLGVNFMTSSVQTISTSGDIDCSVSSNPSTTLSIYCQMAGKYNASIACDDCTAATAHSSVANTTVLTCYSAEKQKFVFRNTSGGAIAAFDSKGYLYLRGFNVSNQGTLSPTRNSFIIKNNTGVVVAYINSTGSLFLRGSVSLSQSSISAPKNSFIIRNGTQQHVGYIDSSGNLVLRGKMYFNWTDGI